VLRIASTAICTLVHDRGQDLAPVFRSVWAWMQSVLWYVPKAGGKTRGDPLLCILQGCSHGSRARHRFAGTRCGTLTKVLSISVPLQSHELRFGRPLIKSPVWLGRLVGDGKDGRCWRKGERLAARRESYLACSLCVRARVRLGACRGLACSPTRSLSGSRGRHVLGRHRTTASRQTSLREKPAQTLLHQLRTDGQSEGLLCGCFGGGVGGRLRGSGLMIPPTNKSVATRGYNPRLSPLTRLLQG
jgi:hypothetical protein